MKIVDDGNSVHMIDDGIDYTTLPEDYPHAKGAKETMADMVMPESKRPHCCPVCGGSGKVSSGFYDYFRQSSTIPTEPCRSCGGTGIVWG